MFFDPLYLIFALPGLILAGLASAYTHSTFSKYSQVRARSNMTGAEAARRMLDSVGLRNVRIERTEGFLSDHYDPTVRTLRLSPDVFDQPSLSAIGVACHEAGHALQHAEGSISMHIRSQLVPLANIGSYLSYIVIIAGFLFQASSLVYFGAFLFGVTVLFAIVTLPVEWGASAKAKRYIVRAGIVTAGESAMASSVLNAAFLTYVASAVNSLLILIYYLLRARSMDR